METGRLDKRIDIMAVSYSRSTKGAMTPTFSKVTTVWAEYIAQGGREFYAAQKMNAEVTAVFRIRYRVGMRRDWRIRYGHRQFDIIFVDDMNARQGELLLHCKEIFENE